MDGGSWLNGRRSSAKVANKLREPVPSDYPFVPIALNQHPLDLQLTNHGPRFDLSVPEEVQIQLLPLRAGRRKIRKIFGRSCSRALATVQQSEMDGSKDIQETGHSGHLDLCETLEYTLEGENSLGMMMAPTTEDELRSRKANNTIYLLPISTWPSRRLELQNLGLEVALNVTESIAKRSPSHRSQGLKSQRRKSGIGIGTL
jgi:hypothetical protein